MAEAATIEKVRAGIIQAFETATERCPTNEDIIARSEVSSASFYRVLEQHEEVKLLLDTARLGYGIGAGADDPIASKPHKAVQELRSVIAALVEANHQLEEQLDRKDKELERLAAQVPDGRVTSIRQSRATRPSGYDSS